MTRTTITYKGLSIRDPAPYGEAGLAWQNNFIAIADTLDSLQGSLDTALGGLVIGTDIQAYSANLDVWSGVAPSADGQSLVAAVDYAAMRGLLGVRPGADVQGYSAALGAIAGLTPIDGNVIVGDGSTWVAESGATARASLGLGTMATQAADAVAITGGVISGIADLAVADGGTGASDAAGARANLGLAIGADVQAHSANLDTWAGVLPSANGQSLVSAADYAAMRGLLDLEPGTDVQAYSSRLGAIAALTPTDGNLIVGNGTTWVTQSGETARTTLGLGTMATQGAGAVAITGGTIDGTVIGATAPSTGSFTTLTSGELAIPSDTKGLALDAAGTTTLYGNGSYLVTNRGMINPGTLVEVAGKNKTQVYGHDGTYPYLVYQPYVWGGTSWTATNGFGFGLRALANNTGTDCAGVGSYALYGNTGNACAGLGWSALSANRGAESSGIGWTVLQNNTGAQSTGFGSRALRYNTGANAVAIGHRSGEKNIGGDNSLVGLQSGMYNTGKQSTGLGCISLIHNTGDNTVAMGYSAGQYNQGNYNTLIGSRIGYNFDANDSAAKTFDADAVDAATDRITIPAHGFGATGSYKNLKFTQGTSPITGLTSGNIYQAKIIDADTIGFNELDGPNGTTRTIANITAAGTGTGHTFTPQYEYSNVTCLGAKSAPTASNQVTLGDTAVTEVKTSGVILPGGYKAADGTAGISKTITFKDADAVTHTLVFKDGLLTSHTTT